MVVVGGRQVVVVVGIGWRVAAAAASPRAVAHHVLIAGNNLVLEKAKRCFERRAEVGLALSFREGVEYGAIERDDRRRGSFDEGYRVRRCSSLRAG